MTRILVIDDAQADRRLLRDALEADGFEVEEAQDGQEGLRKLFADHPDAVVLDVLMPGMDGWTVCARIREFTETPIIMLTSLDREEEIVRGLELGADDFVSKPVSPRQLIARVKAVLRRAHSHTDESGEFRYDDGDLVIDTVEVLEKDTALVLDQTHIARDIAARTKAGDWFGNTELTEIMSDADYFVRVYKQQREEIRQLKATLRDKRSRLSAPDETP